MSERDERLQNAIDRIKNLDDSMKVNLKGKKYTMVAQRVQAFREAFGCGANISTEIVVCDDTKVIVKATVSVQRDGAGGPIATEFVGASAPRPIATAPSAPTEGSSKA